MHSGNGTGVGVSEIPDGGESGTHNIWTWRVANSGAVGGRILTRSDFSGAYLFLPAVGWRNIGGNVFLVGLNGYYWSSTFGDAALSRGLWFNSSNVGADDGASTRAIGMSVRCVRD